MRRSISRATSRLCHGICKSPLPRLFVSAHRPKIRASPQNRAASPRGAVTDFSGSAAVASEAWVEKVFGGGGRAVPLALIRS